MGYVLVWVRGLSRVQRYPVHSQEPFRIRCAATSCGSKLQHTAVILWSAELVESGVIGQQGLPGLGTEDAHCQGSDMSGVDGEMEGY